MPLLGPVLAASDLPWPELQAARLDGELYRVADAYCPVDEVEQPRHRALAVLGGRSRRLIAELGTAAWIWGAVPYPPPVLEFCADLAARARIPPNPVAVVREVVIEPDDLAAFDGVRVTRPVRTAIDLARFRDPFLPVDAETVAELARLGGFGLEECLAALGRRRNLPAKRRAIGRLQAVLTR